jgi:hypothetical protein
MQTVIFDGDGTRVDSKAPGMPTGLAALVFQELCA